MNGIVQGVGFRPFVYRIAKGLPLTGYVLNLGDAGVRIVAEGEEEDLLDLIDTVKHNPPSISRIDVLEVDWQLPTGEFTDFDIASSSLTRNDDAVPVIPPDIAMCDNCVQDLFSPESRWFLYPFTSCAACGPRFSTITDLPYDRPNTTMVDFPLCTTCNTGYTSPADRRYHAQTTACQECGPEYRLIGLGQNRVEIIPKESIKAASNLLKKGMIVAVQGIAGTHLVTITSGLSPISRLRENKKRSQRPFAIMARDLGVVRSFFDPTEKETDLMTSWRRPIVLVKKRSADVLSVLQEKALDLISPGLDTVGVMLPYAPLHHLLFNYTGESSLVVTSANPAGIPMYTDPDTIVSSLEGIADYALVHNRRIYQRADDSVIKFVREESPVFIRRARGYVPEPLRAENIPQRKQVLALGAEEKATACIMKGGRLYLTQHIGDTDRVESLEFLSNAHRHLMQLIGATKLEAVACDLHPEFLSTEMAEGLSEDLGIPIVRVQHHHAHLASILADSNIPPDTSIVCITADGYGYGADGSAWGGEVLVGDAGSSDNVGGLMAQQYSGRDLSATYAVRPLIGLLAESLDPKDFLKITTGMPLSPNTKISEETLDTILSASSKRINTIASSSTGRVLDAIAALLGICSHNSYDGECPMKLESLSERGDIVLDSFLKKQGKRTIIDTSQLLMAILRLKEKGLRKEELAFAAQWYLGVSFAEIASEAAIERGLTHVGFSGGVALNRIMTNAVYEIVKEKGLVPLIHREVPPGDGGVSVGQALTASVRI
jgi:hydrogenase maturation protein HypF